MRTVGIDARKYFDYGIGTYVQGLLGEFTRRECGFRFTLFLSPGEMGSVKTAPTWGKVEVPWKKYSMAELLFLGKKAAREGVDLLHIPHYTLPVGFAGPSVVTIHDLIHLRFPQHYSWAHRAYARGVMGHALRTARAIVAVSEFVKNDILSQFRVKPEKIHVVPLAARSGFQPLPKSSINNFRKRHGLVNPYVLYVGGMGKHKDIPTLMKSFDIVAGHIKNCDLVFAGIPADQGRKHVSSGRFASRIRFVGRLPGLDLTAAYNAAEVLLMTSTYEGFGLPPLEAMACGTPCVVSDAGSLPEVVGQAAVLCRTGRPGEFADGVMTLLTRSRERNKLIRRGYENLRRFSWRTTATRTLQIYESVA